MGAQQAALLIASCPHIAGLASTNAGSDTCVAIINSAPTDRPETRNPASGRALVVEAVLPIIVSLSVQVNGRKLLQTIITRLPVQDVLPLYDAVAAQLMTIATDQCGCITLQRMCDGATEPTLRQRLHTELMDAAADLITDQYGNYALQHAVKESLVCSRVVAQVVAPRIIDLATDKYASNVIERCLQNGAEDVRELLISLVARPEVLDVLMQDSYGNYVVQSCIEQAPAHYIELLKDLVLPRVPLSPYGYRIETKLQHRIKRNGRGVGGGSGGGGSRRRGGYHQQDRKPTGSAPPQYNGHINQFQQGQAVLPLGVPLTQGRVPQQIVYVQRLPMDSQPQAP